MLQQFAFQRFLSLDIQVVGRLIEQTSACVMARDYILVASGP
jgi:hypothetical protein